VALSYDSPETLAAFADRHAITYPLLSDTGSKIIDAWGLRNQGARGRELGVPHPGTFIIDRQLRVVERAFEQAYQERNTAAGILARIGGAVAPAAPANLEGGQLTATLGVSDATVPPGGRVTLIVDLKPKPKMHVYAPGQAGYIPVTLTLDPTLDYKAQPAKFPAPGTYLFAPLKETVKVYDKPIRVTQEITLGLSQDLRRRATAKDTLVITGSLAYQACDDKVCYRSETLPLSWSLALTPFVR
jgi:DsbC/DsbD-like thiol-disulfide interchange protein